MAGKTRTMKDNGAQIAISINYGLDEKDKEILQLLLIGNSNRSIATKLKIPLSTVQRRTRKLFQRDILRTKYELNYNKLGLRRGLLHVYLKNGNIQAIANRLLKIPGVKSTSIHIGNSDIVGLFVFQQTQDLLNIISECKKIDGIERVVWSEEVKEVVDTD